MSSSTLPKANSAEVVRGTFVRPGVFYQQLERGMQPWDVCELLARIMQHDQAAALECGHDVATPALPEAEEPGGAGRSRVWKQP